MWSWLIPQTANLIEYFGFASASWPKYSPGPAISWITRGPSGVNPNAPSVSPASIPAEPKTPPAAVLKKFRRPTLSSLIISPNRKLLLPDHILPGGSYFLGHNKTTWSDQSWQSPTHFPANLQ